VKLHLRRTVRAAPVGLTLRPEPVHIRRLTLAALLITAAFGGLIARLFVLQVLRHDEKAALMDRGTTSYDNLPGRRGDIRTSDGTILARDVTEFTVALDPSQILPENLPKVCDLISRGLSMADEDRRTIQSRLKDRMLRAERGEGRRPRFIVFRRGVGEGLKGELERAVSRILSPPERKGIIFQPIHSREYPRGSFLGVVVGGTKQGGEGTDLAGISGLELALDPTLSGKDGQRKLRCEGRRIDRWFVPGEVDVQPVHGYNAVLTIDGLIQGIAEEELELGLEKVQAAAGIALVMDCRSGDILAMVNLPSLDPNHYHDYPAREFKERRVNRVIEAQYEPGSTIKPFFAALALEKGLFRLDEQVWGGGRTCHFGRRLVTDVRDHGPITFAEAVIHSSNIGMSHVGLRLGRDGLIEALDRFHFQRKTGIGLPDEARGKRTQRNKWSENFTTVSVSYGYEVMMTPLQLCAGYASLVNGGHLYTPRIIDRLERDGEEIPFPRAVEVGRPIQESTSRIIREILIDVVEKGTAKALKIPGFTYGAKTGTRQSAGTSDDYLSSFIAFAPAEEPRLVVMVMVERPKNIHFGSTVAGPVVTGILKRVFHLGVEPTVSFGPTPGGVGAGPTRGGVGVAGPRRGGVGAMPAVLTRRP
jgi:cell division protein FtsI (penicillin-binding protein 3)